MSRDINFKKPLEGADAAFVRDRPWMVRDAELSGIKVRFADDPDGDFEVEETDDSAYPDADWTVKTLKAEIESRNEERDEDEQITPESNKKVDLIAALEADDEAQADEEPE